MHCSRSILLFGLLPALLLGCGDGGETHAITDVRTRETVRRAVPEGMSASERYGYRRRGDGAPAGHGGQARQTFGWSTPAGWSEQTPAEGSIRKGSWTVDGVPDTDCSLVALGGSGGGLKANVNRWRGEMGLDPVDDAAIAALPRRLLLGREAASINLTGTFSGGRSGRGPLENARMLGIVLSLPQATLFLKLTGPAAAVEAQQGAFEALSDSITFGAPRAEGPAKGAAPKAGAPKGVGFAWDAPEGWEQQPAKTMRVVTFVPADAPTAWCYVSRLGGTAGGLAMNVNRWRGEMGHREPLDDAGVAALETIEMLGSKGTLLDLEGDFAGTGGPPQKAVRMLGVVCSRAGDTIFVKMVGPPDAIAKHRAAFLALCTSLREAR